MDNAPSQGASSRRCPCGLRFLFDDGRDADCFSVALSYHLGGCDSDLWNQLVSASDEVLTLGLGVEAKGLLRKRARGWSELRRYEIGADAILVSPFAKKTWLDRYRGMILLLGNADREQVVEALEANLPRNGPGASAIRQTDDGGESKEEANAAAVVEDEEE